MSDVAAIIEREIELISRFITALKEEQDALKQGDVAALTDLTARKMLLVEQLNSMETERLGAINLAGADQGRGSMEKWLAQNSNEQAAAVNWQKLLNLASEAKSLHELNAQLVDMHLRQTSEILAILTQQPEKQTLYGSSGQAVPATGSRIVDSA